MMITEPFDYDAVFVGDTFQSTFVMTESLVKSYREAVGDSASGESVPSYLFAIYNPIYAAFGGRIAPGTIHLKQRMEHYGKVKLNDEIKVVVTVKEKYKKGEKDYFKFEAVFLKDDKPVCKHETTHLWALA